MNHIECIPGLKPEFSDQLICVLESEPVVSEVILYGSRAKGNYRAGSDIDLTIKGKNLTTNWLMDLSMKLDDLLLPYEVDLSIFEHIENNDLVEHINRVGKVVYKK